MTETKRTCFVLMPFSVRPSELSLYDQDESHWIEVYDGLIAPALRKAEFSFERDDEDKQSRIITDQIWQKIETADLILADISSSNPNVFLELGWALRADKKFILMKDDITDFQFDTRSIYTTPTIIA